MENPIQRDVTGGTPILGNLHLVLDDLDASYRFAQGDPVNVLMSFSSFSVRPHVPGARTSASSKYDGTNSGASAPKTSMANFKPVMQCLGNIRECHGMSLDDG